MSFAARPQSLQQVWGSYDPAIQARRSRVYSALTGICDVVSSAEIDEVAWVLGPPVLTRSTLHADLDHVGRRLPGETVCWVPKTQDTSGLPASELTRRSLRSGTKPKRESRKRHLATVWGSFTPKVQNRRDRVHTILLTADRPLCVGEVFNQLRDEFGPVYQVLPYDLDIVGQRTRNSRPRQWVAKTEVAARNWTRSRLMKEGSRVDHQDLVTRWRRLSRQYWEVVR